MSPFGGNSHELRHGQLPVGGTSQEVSQSISGELRCFSYQKQCQKPTHFPIYCNRTCLTVPTQPYLWLANRAEEELNTTQLLSLSPCEPYHAYVMSKHSRIWRYQHMARAR